MHIHPLTLPEIVLIIGKHIPLWIPEIGVDGTAWLFRPKDLVATISINRLFHKTLTPLLWTVCAYPHDESIKYLSSSYQGGHCRLNEVTPNIIRKNSIFIRYLDLSYNYGEKLYTLDRLQLTCTRLKELKLPQDMYSSDMAPLSRLLQANPGLRYLKWKRYSKLYFASNYIKVIFPLRQLRHLCLMEWSINSVYLHHILCNNANSLEELELGHWSRVPHRPPMNENWNGLDLTTEFSLTNEEQTEAAELIQGRSLLLRNLKTLHLLNRWDRADERAVCNLVRAFPALETLIIGFVYNDTALLLGKVMKECCPNIRSIQGKPDYMTGDGSLPGYDGIGYVVGGCLPGKLVDFSLNRQEFDAKLADALMEHRNGLEILNVELSDKDLIIQSCTNVRKVLEGCRRLKEFSMRINHAQYKEQDTFDVLIGLKVCRTLERLSFYGPLCAERDDLGRSDEAEEGTMVGYGAGDEPLCHIFILLSGWQHSKSNEDDHRYRRPLTDAFKNKVFENVRDIPALKNVELNEDLFQKMAVVD
ncbi:MAG: hypothetical protein J3R72DRAFT_492347 [Linnemannia gamsii]|nr:MAG: hypothetical protein J3R72DRAFT_492347 [Linnemannia gamsii]